MKKGVLFLIMWSKIVDNGQSSGLSDKIQGAKKRFCLASFSGFKHHLEQLNLNHSLLWN